jgi:NADPH:quinone reductase-like Zn-dependent oxidoreductase
MKTIKKLVKIKAFVKNIYGGPEVLQLNDIEKPILKDDHILVKAAKPTHKAEI